MTEGNISGVGSVELGYKRRLEARAAHSYHNISVVGFESAV